MATNFYYVYAIKDPGPHLPSRSTLEREQAVAHMTTSSRARSNSQVRSITEILESGAKPLIDILVEDLIGDTRRSGLEVGVDCCFWDRKSWAVF